MSASASEFAPGEISGGEEVASLRAAVTVHFKEPIETLLPLLAGFWSEVQGRAWSSALQVARSTRDLAPRLLPENRAEIGDAIRGAVSQPLYGLRIDDGAAIPSHSIELRAVPDYGGHPRTSYLRVLLPPDAPVGELVSLADRLAETLPVWHGSAGLSFVYRPPSVAVAFDQIWAWSRRYLGPGITCPPAETWDAPSALSGLNWLTLVSDAFAAAHLASSDFGAALPGGVSARRKGSGWILRAGESPRYGDLHRFERLDDCTTLAELLGAALPADPTPLPGMFKAPGSTRAWQRRWLDPMAWHDLQL